MATRRSSADDTPEALGLLELSSIGRGARVVDAVAKKAPVTVHTAEPVSSGKYLLVFTGDVGSVEESFHEAVAVAGTTIVNKLLLWQVDPQVVRAFQRRIEVVDVDALAIVESTSLATTISAADVAVKAAGVTLIEIRLGHGIGGKGYFTLTGSQPDVEASVAAALGLCEKENSICGVEIINRPHQDLVDNLTRGAHRSRIG